MILSTSINIFSRIKLSIASALSAFAILCVLSVGLAKANQHEDVEVTKLRQLWYSQFFSDPIRSEQKVQDALTRYANVEVSQSTQFDLNLGLIALWTENGKRLSAKKLISKLSREAEKNNQRERLDKLFYLSAKLSKADGQYEDRSQELESIFASTDDTQTNFRGALQSALASEYWQRSNFEKTIAALSEAYHQYIKGDDIASASAVKLKLAYLAARQKNFEFANKQLEDVKLIVGPTSNRELKALVALHEGKIREAEGKLSDAIALLENALASTNPQNQEVRANILFELGTYYWTAGNSTRSNNFLNKAIKSAESINNRLLTSSIYQVMAQIQRLSKNYESALVIHQRLLKEAESTGDMRMSAFLLCHIATIYRDLELYEEAFSSAARGLELAKSYAGSEYHIHFRCSWNLANSHKENDQFTEAIGFLKEALKYAEHQKRVEGIVMVTAKLAETYADMGNFKDALFHADTMAKYLEKTERPATKINILTALARLNAKRNIKDLAEKQMNEAFQVANSVDQDYLLNFVIAQSVEIYELLASWKQAYDFLLRHIEIKESEFQEKNQEAIASQIADYDKAAKQAEIDLLSKENDLKRIQIAEQRSDNLALMISSVAIIIIVSLLVLRHYSRRKRKNLIRHADKINQYAEQISLMTKAFLNTNNATWITDASFKIIEVNRAHEKVTGFKAKEVLGKVAVLENGELNYRSLNHSYAASLQDANAIDQNIIDNPSSGWSGEASLTTAQGKSFPIEFSIQAIRDSEGNITHHLGIFRDITERVRYQHELKRLATHDSLTNLPNRSLFQEILERSCVQPKPEKRVALLFIDLDNFKLINDSVGHDFGDEILMAVVDRLQAIIASDHVLARIGGDEFCLMLESRYPLEKSGSLAQNILTALEPPFDLMRREQKVNASIGIAIFPNDGRNAVDLMSSADIAMYSAKNTGKGGFKYFETSMNELLMEEFHLEKRLKLAIEEEVFHLLYQPKVDMTTQRIVGAEALVRWQERDNKIIFPDEFIPLAEKSGLIVDIDRIVVHKACQQIATWKLAGFQPGKVAINLSGAQFQRPEKLLALMLTAVKRYQLSPEDLELEITEGMLLEDADKAIETLNKLKSHGFTIALDDFGTGYSSLSYIQRLPIQVLKIDRSFISNIHESKRDLNLTSAIIDMAQKLNISLVAEGVEYAEQLSILEQLGCQAYQGYYFSKPILPSEFQTLLKTHLEKDLQEKSS